MPPPPLGGSTINPTFVQNNNSQVKYEPQSYFKGGSSSVRRLSYSQDLASDPNLFSFNLSSYNFGSETANLEYSILSNMLNASGLTPTSDASHSHPTPPPHITSPTAATRNSFPELAMQDIHWQDSHMIGSFPYTTMAGPTTGSLTSPSPPAPSPSNPPPTPITAHSQIHPPQISPASGGVEQQVKRGPGRPKGRKDTNPRQVGHHHHRDDTGDVYSKVTKPFSYVDGFHELTRYLRRRFQKHELLRISLAMAKYRPSFIALTKTLKEEDLVFMEKCFQRTLLVLPPLKSASDARNMKSLFRIVGHQQLYGDEQDR